MACECSNLQWTDEMLKLEHHPDCVVGQTPEFAREFTSTEDYLADVRGGPAGLTPGPGDVKAVPNPNYPPVIFGGEEASRVIKEGGETTLADAGGIYRTEWRISKVTGDSYGFDAYGPFRRLAGARESDRQFAVQVASRMDFDVQKVKVQEMKGPVWYWQPDCDHGFTAGDPSKVSVTMERSDPDAYAPEWNQASRLLRVSTTNGRGKGVTLDSIESVSSRSGDATTPWYACLLMDSGDFIETCEPFEDFLEWWLENG